MRKTINWIVSKLKGEPYCIDEAIPISYILNFLFVKVISFLYGLIKLRGGGIFIRLQLSNVLPKYQSGKIS